MPEPLEPASGDEAFWREYLTRGDAMETRARRVLKLLPHGPRCKLCAAPFAGPGAPFMRAIGKRPATKNPAVCNGCFEYMNGSDIETSSKRGVRIEGTVGIAPA